jgi:hypothetical protein
VVYTLDESSTEIKLTYPLGHETDEIILAIMVGESILFELADGGGLTFKVDKYRFADDNVHIDGSIIKRYHK